MAFDAFTRFPRAFSGRPALARRIYESLRRSLGPSFNQEFNGSRVQARLYAQAMGMAHAMRTLDRVKKNAIALSATELLSNLESLHGLIPRPNATFRERRHRLHARMQVLRGGRYEAVQTIMRSLLGEDFEAWVYATLGTLVRIPDWTDSARLKGNYVHPGTQARILRTMGPIFPGEQTVAVEELTPVTSASQQPVGMTFLADPAHNIRRESSTIEDAERDESGAIVSVTATFAQPHDSGTLLTTQYFPTWRSNAHHHMFQMSESAARDAGKRQIVNEELVRVLKSIATWDLREPGELAVEEGLLGITPVGDEA